jgi:hypothetical protein
MPRTASISSTMRRLSGKREQGQIAWPMTSGGNRWPAYRGGVDSVMPGRVAGSPPVRNLLALNPC